MKRLQYRGYIITEQNNVLLIYKDDRIIKRIETNWKSGLTQAKIEIDKIIKRFGNWFFIKISRIENSKLYGMRWLIKC